MGLRTTRRLRNGFTLIEILIAMTVLVVGLVGILALFPVGIKSGTESVEDTNAAIIASSVHHALTNALRLATLNNPGPAQFYTCQLSHDLHVGNAEDGSDSPASVRGLYAFQLPPTPNPPRVPPSSDWYRHPDASPGVPAFAAGGDLGSIVTAATPRTRVFKLGWDPGGTTATPGDASEDAQGAIAGGPSSGLGDPTEPYRQYAFAFEVKKVIDPVNPVVDTNLFEFAIQVYRRVVKGGAATAGTSDAGVLVVEPAGTYDYLLIKELRARISVR